MNKVWLKRLIALLCIIGMVLAVEIWFNRRAILYGYKDKSLNKNLVFEEKEDASESIYKAKLDRLNNLFVHDVLIYTKDQCTGSYSLSLTYTDPYGNEKKTNISDGIQEWFNVHSTYINKYLTSLEITIYGLEADELQNVKLTNRIEWNKFRILFVLIMGLLFYLCFFEKVFTDRPEWFFAAFTLATGLVIILSVGLKKASWDEQEHFKRVIQIAEGEHVQLTEAEYDFANVISATCNTKTELRELRNYMNAPERSVIVLEDRQEAPYFTYDQFGYLPSLIFVKLGQFLHLNFEKLFYLGKLGNLLFYIVIMFLAIRVAREKKLFLILIALLPTPVFQASSYTYDSVVFSLITLGMVLLFREVDEGGEKPISYRNFLLSIICIVLGSLSKAVYIPLILLWAVPIMQRKLIPTRKKLCILAGIVVVLAVIMFTFVMPALSNAVSGNLSYGGDKRGGDTGMVRQIYSMLAHPLHTMWMFLTQILKFDNFRNLGYASADNHVFINLMFLNFGSLHVLPDKWCVLLTPLLLIIAAAGEAPKMKSKRTYVYIFLVIASAVGLIWLAMYLSFTPVGTDAIYGVQARYYLPLLFAFSGLLNFRRGLIALEKRGTLCMIYGISWLLMGESIYLLLLENRYFPK